MRHIGDSGLRANAHRRREKTQAQFGDRVGERSLD